MVFLEKYPKISSTGSMVNVIMEKPKVGYFAKFLTDGHFADVGIAKKEKQFHFFSL